MYTLSSLLPAIKMQSLVALAAITVAFGGAGGHPSQVARAVTVSETASDVVGPYADGVRGSGFRRGFVQMRDGRYRVDDRTDGWTGGHVLVALQDPHVGSVDPDCAGAGRSPMHGMRSC
jgi:hypothetical protein